MLEAPKIDWQPIETAPRDGTEVLVWCDGRPHVAGYRPLWHPNSRTWLVDHAERPEETTRTVTDLGPDLDKDGNLHLMGRKGPTHWIPIPQAPADL